MVRQIRVFPDPVLRIKAAPVDTVTDEIRTLLDDMAETMYAAPGVGLAAPQVGVSKQVIVVDLTAGKEPDNLMEFINPVITFREGEEMGEEGCLSIPEEYAHVNRATKIIVQAMNRDGELFTLEADDYLARALQHEIDHLHGVLYIDRLPPVKRDTVKKHIKKRMQAGDYVPTGV